LVLFLSLNQQIKSIYNQCKLKTDSKRHYCSMLLLIFNSYYAHCDCFYHPLLRGWLVFNICGLFYTREKL